MLQGQKKKEGESVDEGTWAIWPGKNFIIIGKTD